MAEARDASGKAVDQMPSGYRQGIVTASTIFISFSLFFFRYWSFEAPGEWNVPTTTAAALMVLSIVLQLYTLWRSLQVRDSLIVEYERTTRFLFAAIVVLILAVAVAAVSVSGLVHR